MIVCIVSFVKAARRFHLSNYRLTHGGNGYHESRPAFSKTIIIKDIIEELAQYATDKSFQDTMQIILQSLPIKHWPSIETESRPFVVKTG